MNEHISDLRWDQLIAGDLAPDVADAARAHASSCAACNARLVEIEAQARAFDMPMPTAAGGDMPATARADMPTTALDGGDVARTQPRTSRDEKQRGRIIGGRARWTIAAAAVVALAAGLFLVIRPRGELSDTRTKGRGAQLALLGGPSLAPLASGDPIKPGDRLQAVYSANRDGFGAVLSIDRNNKPTSYVPSSGTNMVALPAGTQVSYPESTIADATTGEELVVVLWCEDSQPLQPLLDQLRTRHVSAPSGCTKLEVTISK